MTGRIETIGIVGAGTMGSGIALTALYQGIPVVLQDVDQQALERARGYIETYLVRNGLEAHLGRLSLVDSLQALAGADLVVEAILEDLAAKRKLFRQLDGICPPPAVLATNTSTLSVTVIAAATEHPHRVAGFHFFNPAPVMPLIELIRGAETSAETLKALERLARKMEKTAVQVGDTPGFLVNRVARPFYGEALRMLAEGVAKADVIDEVAESGGGFQMGPFRLMDLIGLDVNLAASTSMYEQTFGESRYRPHWIQQRMVAQGWLGRKAGRGFYDYGLEAQPNQSAREPAAADLTGAVWISPGSWAPGFAQRVHQVESLQATGQVIDEDTVAAVIAAGAGDSRREWLERADRDLPEGAPLLCQAADLTVAEMSSWIPGGRRLVGFDGLFLEGGLVTLAAAPHLAAEIRAKAEQLCLNLGLRPVWITDSPGLILPRMLAMLVNEAAFAVLEGAAAETDVDLAMQLGARYPQGPLAWGRALGLTRIIAILEHLKRSYGEERFRVCTLLRRWAWPQRVGVPND